MHKHLLNKSLEVVSILGNDIQPSGFFIIPKEDEVEFAFNSEIVSLILEEKLSISIDGINEMSGTKYDRLNYFQSKTDVQRDSENAPISRHKMAPSGWHFQYQAIEVELGKINSVYSKKSDLTDFGFCTLKFYKLVDGVETLMVDPTQEQVDLEAVRTEIDWMPTHDYELVGGQMKYYENIIEDVRFWCIGVPDIPYAMGGSKEFIPCINLRYLSKEEGLNSDGRVCKYMTYDPISPTNKLRFLFRHPIGYKIKVQVCIEMFIP